MRAELVWNHSEKFFEEDVNEALEKASAAGEVLVKAEYSTVFVPEHRGDFGEMSACVQYSVLLFFDFDVERIPF